jgi:hypothetical protein
MRNRLELLGALGIIALIPLGIMALVVGFGSFIAWGIPSFEWVFVRVGLSIGLPLAALALADKDFRELFKE